MEEISMEEKYGLMDSREKRAFKAGYTNEKNYYPKTQNLIECWQAGVMERLLKELKEGKLNNDNTF